jgi:hypothetical protein
VPLSVDLSTYLYLLMNTRQNQLIYNNSPMMSD